MSSSLTKDGPTSHGPPCSRAYAWLASHAAPRHAAHARHATHGDSGHATVAARDEGPWEPW